MRRLALLFAGGALWILLAATPVFADGGPHVLVNNNGTAGLAGDCAACHRAHTAQAADLLKASEPGLCLTCHNGTGATTDVVDGVQYTPTGNATFQQSTVLGALRGGGFSYALIDSGNASRLTYASRGAIILTYGAAPASGSMTLTWPAFGTFGGGTLTFNTTDTAATIQTTANTVFGTSTTYTTSTAASNMSGATTNLMSVSVSTTAHTVSFTPKNEFALIATIPLPTVTANGSGTTAVMSSTIQANAGDTSHVGVLAVANKQPETSTHEGAGTVWGNGPQGQGNVGATGVVLDCTSCHNPHGNGQYRILDTLPGEDWANNAVTASTTLAANVTTGTQTSISVTSATGFPTTDFVITVGTEQMLVTGGQGTTTWTVTRGYNSTTPGSPASGTAVNMVTSSWTAPTNAVAVVDVGSTASTKNYTVLPGVQASNVTAAATAGDYFRYKYDPSGAANFTNFYLLQDPMNTGWNGTSATNPAAIGTGSTTLAAAVTTTTASSISVTAEAAFPATVPFYVNVDSELMQVTAEAGTGPYTWTVTRGLGGTTAATHTSGAPVTVNATTPLWNTTGLLTAWCITCHTRYNGYSTAGTTSTVAATPIDSVFMFKHGTTRIGCEQCHVSHGTDALMTATFSSTYTFPDGTAEDSALLKVNNRGTCNLCHDPTGTVTPGTTVGIVPGAITPGP